jgi:hypothetical protein
METIMSYVRNDSLSAIQNITLAQADAKTNPATTWTDGTASSRASNPIGEAAEQAFRARIYK